MFLYSLTREVERSIFYLHTSEVGWTSYRVTTEYYIQIARPFKFILSLYFCINCIIYKLIDAFINYL